MKWQIKSEFESQGFLAKLISFFRCQKGTPIEGYEGAIVIRIIPLDEEAHTTIETMIELLSPGIFTYQMYGEFATMDLTDGEKTKGWPITYPVAGMSELRVYIKDLKNDDIILDDKNVVCKYSLTYPHSEVPKGTRFYMRPVKIFSMIEIILYIFAGISTIGALFEILSFFLKK